MVSFSQSGLKHGRRTHPCGTAFALVSSGPLRFLEGGYMQVSIWLVLAIVLMIVAAVELFRAEGLVTRPIAVLILVLAALETIFLLGWVAIPGTIGLTGWLAIISTAILIFSVELMRITGGIRGTPLALLLFLISAVQLFLTIGFIRL
jgi:hypothetical protein